MKFILGKKICMTQVFLPSGEVIPVTKIQAGPCQITQITGAEDKESRIIQLGFGETKIFRLKKPQTGHLKDLKPTRILRSFLLDKTGDWQRGDEITVETFEPGDKVQVTGVSKGRGFAGVVKRHHFAGGPASHGHKDNLRAPGSIGAGGVQRVFKGVRMAGRMGGQQVSIKNLEIVQIDPEKNELYIKGAVPGGRNALVIIAGEGELKITKKIKEEIPNAAEPAVSPMIEDKPAVDASEDELKDKSEEKEEENKAEKTEKADK